MNWLALILASACEICWLYCIRVLNNTTFDSLITLEFLEQENGVLILLAILGYAVFGIANVLFFSMAMKKIPATIAFSIWTGMALAGTTLIDAYIIEINFTTNQGIFMTLIFAGITGMKIVTPSSSNIKNG